MRDAFTQAPAADPMDRALIALSGQALLRGNVLLAGVLIRLAGAMEADGAAGPGAGLPQR